MLIKTKQHLWLRLTTVYLLDEILGERETDYFEGVSYFITLQDKFNIKVVKINEETGMTIIRDLKR